MNQQLIPASILTGVFDLAVSKQLNMEELLTSAEIDPSFVGSQDAFLTTHQFENLLTALIKAFSSTTPALDVLIKIAPSFIYPNIFSSKSPFVSGVTGKCRDTISAIGKV